MRIAYFLNVNCNVYICIYDWQQIKRSEFKSTFGQIKNRISVRISLTQ